MYKHIRSEILKPSEKLKEELSKHNGKQNNIGANPFPENNYRIVNLSYCFESIYYEISKPPEDVNGYNIPEINYNPFVIINNEKYYYQRDLCWNLEQKQALIDSVYNSVECGSIIIISREWYEVVNNIKNGYTDICFKDVVDGKQRLHTMLEFINDEFVDSYGNFFSDLSEKAKRTFLNNKCFNWCVMEGDLTPTNIINQFLKTNFEGKPQSKEHMDFVKSLYEKTLDKV